MAGVMNGLGHAVTFRRGEVLYESPGFFPKLMFVRRGLIVKAMMDAHHEDPLLLSIGGPGSLCGCYETLYLSDRIPRRHWCMTTAEVLVVNSDLLLRICDQNAHWQREITNYTSLCAMADRYGLLLNHTASLEERLAVFFVLCEMQGDPFFQSRLYDESLEWIRLSTVPSRRVVAGIVDTSVEKLRTVLNSWQEEDVLRYRSHKLLLRRDRLIRSWHAMQGILDLSD